MDRSGRVSSRPATARLGRLSAAVTLALAIALSTYILIDATRAHRMAFASLWFLAVLPALLCALVCYLADPSADRPAGFYWRVPPLLVGCVVAGSAFFLHEGVICLIMLSPIWLLSGWTGAFVLRARRTGMSCDAPCFSCRSWLAVPRAR